MLLQQHYKLLTTPHAFLTVQIQSRHPRESEAPPGLVTDFSVGCFLFAYRFCLQSQMSAISGCHNGCGNASLGEIHSHIYKMEKSILIKKKLMYGGILQRSEALRYGLSFCNLCISRWWMPRAVPKVGPRSTSLFTSSNNICYLLKLRGSCTKVVKWEFHLKTVTLTVV